MDSDQRRLSEVAASCARVHTLVMERVSPVLRGLMRGNDLSYSEFSAIMQLFTHGQMKIAGIAQATGLTHNAASRLVDRLVQAGYVSRAEDAQDRRQKRVELTPVGHALPEGLHTATIDAYRVVLSKLPAETRDRLAKAVGDLNDRLPAPAQPLSLSGKPGSSGGNPQRQGARPVAGANKKAQ